MKQIWQEQRMPEDWKLGTIFPIHKKGDKANCANYRSIILLSVVHKILSEILPNINLTFNQYALGNIKSLNYLSAAINNNSSVQVEIKNRIPEGNKCYHAYSALMKNSLPNPSKLEFIKLL